MAFLSVVGRILEAIIPLYIPVILAYASVKWFKLFTPDQCSGINKFVSKFSIPLLCFQIVSMNNPYKMNLKIVFADILQKFMTFFVLAVIVKISSRGKLSWIITGLSLTTLPNTLIIGIPILKAMYGVEGHVFVNQIIMLQCLIWYNLVLLLFEFNAARETLKPESPLATTPGLFQQETIVKVETGDERSGKAKERKWSKLMLILSKAGRKLIIYPNTYTSLAGFIWACVHFRWDVKLPNVIDKSITIISDGGLGMAMFSLGLFMASQASIISCGVQKSVLAIVLKFIAGPATMALCSLAVGMKGQLFRIAILQAAIPQGIISFVFAKEYNVHPDIMSTWVILGLMIAIPITLAYFYLLALF